nr:PREDICTED: uncharacterized protein LOC106704979 [Latimeria chalumnae]|eukprot:XP_014348696.1 PREDICTED: uncharacterized protein LOC106704979 [Latimeria chalumnae]
MQEESGKFRRHCLKEASSVELFDQCMLFGGNVTMGGLRYLFGLTLVFVFVGLCLDVKVGLGFLGGLFGCVCFLHLARTAEVPGTSNQSDSSTEAGVQTEPPERTSIAEERQDNTTAPKILDFPDAPIVPREKSQTEQVLTEVFRCSYSQFVLPWYNVPEPLEEQVLYQVLLKEFNMAVDLLKNKTRHLESITIAIGVLQILSGHLQNAKEDKQR